MQSDLASALTSFTLPSVSRVVLVAQSSTSYERRLIFAMAYSLQERI